VFCNGDGDEIFIHNITKDEIIFTKGVSNTLFSEINIYYALKKNKNVLALDESISKLKEKILSYIFNYNFIHYFYIFLYLFIYL